MVINRELSARESERGNEFFIWLDAQKSRICHSEQEIKIYDKNSCQRNDFPSLNVAYRDQFS